MGANTDREFFVGDNMQLQTANLFVTTAESNITEPKWSVSDQFGKPMKHYLLLCAWYDLQLK